MDNIDVWALLFGFANFSSYLLQSLIYQCFIFIFIITVDEKLNFFIVKKTFNMIVSFPPLNFTKCLENNTFLAIRNEY